MSRSRMAWGVVLYSMWARSSWPQRSQRQRSGRGQRTSKPWPSWWGSYRVISTPEGKSISIVTLATVYHLVGAAGPISMSSSRTPWGSETGMITPESASDQVPRKSSVSHLKTEEPVSCGHLLALDPALDRRIELAKPSAQIGVVPGFFGCDQGEAGPQDPVIDSRAEQRGATTLSRHPIAMGPGGPFDQAVQPQSPQVIAHLTHGHVVGRLAQERGPMIPQIAAGEPTG